MPDDDDGVMRGFLFLKAVVNRYGQSKAAALIATADKAVRLLPEGVVRTRRQMVNEIEVQMGLTPTMPMSEEGANHVTPEPGT